MGGANRRREQRPGGGSRTPQKVDVGPGWKQTFNAWGGYPVFGSLAVALVVVAVLVWMNRPGSSAGTAPYTPVARKEMNGRIAGSPDAPVKVIEFADFQCPYCKQWADDVEPKFIEEFVNTGKASIQYVSFAFLGEESRRAAEAAECAADQGLFWQYHDLLFLRQGKENSGVYSSANLKKFAEELKQHEPKLDTARFNQCLDSGEKQGVVDAQIKQARDAGVQSTPSFLVNGAALSGVQPIETFRQAVEAATKAAQK